MDSHLESLEIYFHVGYPKAMSTTLQRRVFPFLKQCCYLTLHEDAPETLEYFLQAPTVLSKDLIQAIRRAFARRARRQLDSALFISSEFLTGYPSLIDHFAIAKMIKKVFPNAKVLIILREQFSFLASMYSYRRINLRRETKSPLQFLRDFLTVSAAWGRPLYSWLQYHYLVEAYFSLFGRRNVTVLFFEEMVESPSNTTHLLKKVLRDKLPENLQISKENADIQDSFWFEVADSFIERVPASRREEFIAFLESAPSFSTPLRSVFLNYPESSFLLKKFRDSNQKLRELLGEPLPELWV